MLLPGSAQREVTAPPCSTIFSIHYFVDIHAGEGQPFVGRLYAEPLPCQGPLQDKFRDDHFPVRILAEDTHGVVRAGAPDRRQMVPHPRHAQGQLY